MVLIIDAGNTRVKLAVFEQDSLLCKKVVELDDLITTIEQLNKNYAIKRALLSSVAKISPATQGEIQRFFPLLELHSGLPMPFVNRYETPETLGVDRLALIAAAVTQYKRKNVLVIDAGTCVTFDFVNVQKEYFGGAISPGLTLRYDALHKLTANLPLLQQEIPEDFVGVDTVSCMHSGVYNGLVQEIDGVIAQYKNRYQDLTVILTGGDANFLAKRLKSSIFAHSNFLLEGLRTILEFNLD